MPYRALGLGLLVAGVVVVLVLLLLRTDVRRAAASGPRWRRRLLSAGLGVLVGIGAVAPSLRVAAAPADSGAPARAAWQLEATPEWQHIAATTAEARQVVAGTRGSYPFDEAGKRELLSALSGARMEAITLGLKGLLLTPEVELIRTDLDDLATRVREFRPTEQQLATCYSPQPITVGRDALARLRARLPVLERLAEAGTLPPIVVQAVLATVREDVALLDDPSRSSDIRGGAAGCQPTLGQVKAAVVRIEARLPGDAAAPQGTTQWRVIVDGFGEAAALARRSSTTAEREAVEKTFAAVQAAAGELEAQGRLTAAEVALLGTEVERLRDEVREDPPSDSGAKCYDRADMPPASESAGRLQERLALLERMVAERRVHREVLAALLPALEVDLAIVSDEKHLARLEGAKRTGAEATRDKVRAALARLREMAGAGL